MPYVYIIRGERENKIKYYIGFTTDLHHRIKQHNRFLSGGALCTAGYTWQFCGVISNITSKIDALRIEWRLKFSTRKKNILDRINSFINYVDINYRASPNMELLKNKLFFYVDENLLPSVNKIKDGKNIITFKTQLSPVIIDHLMRSV